MKLELSNLPLSWMKTNLGEFVTSEKGKKPKHQSSVKTNDFNIPYVDIMAFEQGQIGSFTNGEGCRMCYKDDLLMVWDGSRSGLVGKGMNGALGSTLVRINFPGLNNDYAFYFLKSKYLQINSRAKGSGTPHVDPDLLWNYEFPIPPLPEQHRIVAKLEELFSELDNGIANLKKAQAQLKVYRQAVLKAAFEGKLTEQWREQQRTTGALPSADALLAQIQEERHRHYEQQLTEWELAVAEWEANGKDGKRPSKPQKPKEYAPLTEAEVSELSELPEGWTWVKLGNLTWSVKDGPHYSPEYVDSGVPFISGGNIRPSGIDFSSAKFISPELHKELCKRCKPETGDILYTKGGTTGIARVNSYEFEFNVWVHVAVLKITKTTRPFYLQNVLNSPFCYRQAQKFTHGVGNQDLGLTRMVNIILPICSPQEQHQIVQEIESRLSVCDHLEQEIEKSLQQSEGLRQSILKKAFEGKLVPQVPDDEPAAELLRRIKREKGAGK